MQSQESFYILCMYILYWPKLKSFANFSKLLVYRSLQKCDITMFSYFSCRLCLQTEFLPCLSSDAMRPSVERKKQTNKPAPTAWWTLMQYRILPWRACCFWVWVRQPLSAPSWIVSAAEGHLMPKVMHLPRLACIRDQPTWQDNGIAI